MDWFYILAAVVVWGIAFLITRAAVRRVERRQFDSRLAWLIYFGVLAYSTAIRVGGLS